MSNVLYSLLPSHYFFVKPIETIVRGIPTDVLKDLKPIKLKRGSKGFFKMTEKERSKKKEMQHEKSLKQSLKRDAILEKCLKMQKEKINIKIKKLDEDKKKQNEESKDMILENKNSVQNKGNNPPKKIIPTQIS